MSDTDNKIIVFPSEAAGEGCDPDSFTCDPPPISMGTRLADGFGDPETLLNSRDWLKAALKSKGAKVDGGGIGCGQADLDIEIEGCRYNVSIRPII